MEIKNIGKAAKRIADAVSKKERIILYGDADLDGVTSLIILQEALENLGGKIGVVYFPDRENEGYGISKKALQKLKAKAPALLVALDCGISNFEEVKIAKKMGLEVIIVDHHEVLDRLPDLEIIVDPKRKDDPYPFKELANAGITLKLAEILFADKMSDSLRKSFSELAALGTIADMMVQIQDNKKIIEEGMKDISRSWRPGLRAFFESDFLANYDITHKISKIISFLNVRDVENGLPVSFRLLTTPSLDEAKEMVLKVREKAELRKEKIKEIVEEASAIVQGQEEPLIFEGAETWDFSLISAVASSLVQKFGKPAFIYKKMEKESQGTVRVPPGVNSVDLMKKCKDYLLTYGGHQKAAGFRLENANLENFKKCLIENLPR